MLPIHSRLDGNIGRFPFAVIQFHGNDHFPCATWQSDNGYVRIQLSVRSFLFGTLRFTSDLIGEFCQEGRVKLFQAIFKLAICSPQDIVAIAFFPGRYEFPDSEQ